jgi:3-hydroxyacyl-CoA dehydrogenase
MRGRVGVLGGGIVASGIAESAARACYVVWVVESGCTSPEDMDSARVAGCRHPRGPLEFFRYDGPPLRGLS